MIPNKVNKADLDHAVAALNRRVALPVTLGQFVVGYGMGGCRLEYDRGARTVTSYLTKRECWSYMRVMMDGIDFVRGRPPYRG